MSYIKKLNKTIKIIDNIHSLQNLCHQGCLTENVFLDLKRTGYGSSKEKKYDLKKDVSAFANALGGILVIGVAEYLDNKHKVIGISDGIEEELRIREVISSGIIPELIGIEIKRLLLDKEKYVLIIIIPCRRQGVIYTIKGKKGSYEVWIRVDKSNRQLPSSEWEKLRVQAPEVQYHSSTPTLYRISAIIITNGITLLRPVLGFLTAYQLFSNNYYLGAIFYCIGLFTDFMDGAVAVLINGTTERGKFFDQYADAIFNCLSIVGYVIGMFLNGNPWLGVILLLFAGGITFLGRFWIDLHSVLAKIQSGVIRCIFILFLALMLSTEQIFLLFLMVGLPLLGAMVYELASLERDLKSGKRPFRRW